MLKRPYQVALVCIFVFAVYYMSIYNELCVVDDYSAVTDFINAKTLSLREIFLPRSAEGGYYRPLIALSYLLNLHLWDMDLRTLHIDNILIHMANACLVFFLTYLLLPRQKREGSFLPLAAGLLFGLHPIATESVNWISGRTDLIAGFFVLIAAILIAVYRKTDSKYAIIGAIFSVLFGCFGKETALGFIPGAFLLLVAKEEDAKSLPVGTVRKFTFQETIWFIVLLGVTILVEVSFFNFWIILVTLPICILLFFLWKISEGADVPRWHVLSRRIAVDATLVAVAVGLFFAVRSIVFSSNIARIPQTIKLMGQDPNYTLMVFLQSIGFYIKKFLIPIPLNFAIREVDPLYSLLGTIFVFTGVALAAKRTVPYALALAGGFLFAPALPLAFGTIAWTAYAERYIYISTAFWTVALALLFAPRLETLGKRYIVCITGVLLILMGGVVYHRNFIWQKNMRLVRDTVDKSPYFREIRTIYMGELMEAGDLQGAEEQYHIGSSLPSVKYDERLDMKMAELLFRKGKKDEALQMYEGVYKKTHGRSSAALQQIRILLENKISNTKNPTLRMKLARNLEKYMEGQNNRVIPSSVQH